MDELVKILTSNLPAIISAAAATAVTALIAWRQTRSHREGLVTTLQQHVSQLSTQLKAESARSGALEGDLKKVRQEVATLSVKAKKYEAVRAELQKSQVVKTYMQPVVLIGPRGVGKTSLLMQWYAPWISDPLSGTNDHLSAEVPVHDYIQLDTEPHFADPEVKVPVNVHLGLKVHDFPGELGAQQLVRQIIVRETVAVREQTNKEISVVLICMFDASEANAGISEKTTEYYNGDLFRELRIMMGGGNVFIQRLVLVFNKYDLLQSHRGSDASDLSILDNCIKKLEPVLAPLHGICNPAKVCAVFTIVARENMQFKNQGAIIVKAEASRLFVEAFRGKRVAEDLLPQRAPSITASKLGF